jgi:hypothetical protein
MGLEEERLRKGANQRQKTERESFLLVSFDYTLVRTSEPLNGFSQNLKLRSFKKICRHMPILVTIGQQ